MSQTDQIYQILMDGRPHRFDEIQIRLFGGTKYGAFRLGARIWDIKKKYGVEIEGWHDKERRSLYWYAIKKSEPKQASLLNN